MLRSVLRWTVRLGIFEGRREEEEGWEKIEEEKIAEKAFIGM